MEQQQKILTFWDHLEELRHVLFRIAVAVVFLMLVAFLFKDELFAIVLAPKNADFIIYRFFCRIADFMAMPSLCPEVFYVKMINTQLAAQFITHMSVSFYTGFLLASPYVIYQLFRFVSPALYENEKKYSTRIVGWGYFLFMMGVLLNYFLIFPLTFRFLATYQVSMEVENTITLSSYMDTLMMMSLMMGIVFEIPVLCWLFAKLGFLPDAGAQLRACFVHYGPQQAVQKGEGWVLAAKAVVTALAENTLGELESYEKTLEVAVPLPITPPEGTVLVPECWLSTENVQCTCAGGTLEATITVRAEGTILGCTTSPVIGSITLGDPLPDTDPEIALRIYYAQAGEEVFAVARRFHVAPAQILAANQLEEELACLPQAQRLLIPVT